MAETTSRTLTPLSERVVAPETVVPSHPLVAEWRPATLSDVDAVWEVRRASDAVDHPNYVATRDEVEEDLGYSFVDLERDTLLAIGHDGRPLAFGLVLEPPRQETLVREFMNGYVHPEARGKGIGRELIRWQRARGEQRLAASAKALPGWLVGYADRRAPDRERLLTSAGFTAMRWFHTMERDLSLPISDVTPTEPVTIRTYAEAIVGDDASEAVHAARDEAFRDHWGSQPLSDEQWRSLTGGVFVADLSFVAFAADGAIAGVLLTDVNEEDWAGQGFTGAYVSTVAVTRAHRGRRIAPALLAAVLRACADRGWERVVLDVDADNPTGALGLYTGMGFVPTQHETGLVIEY
ncbi:GNAT family N-acetyltransferase [Leifsonia sp. F6_8S_P_1B]|uniref:GNAT family N-acetyltransferase n=1 Tax=Leifsonia williamsii TaxID=3035919 RepID=A0ABT8KFI0_9MICO|nr:GNAT family N-acetyltransferase [Leifsonia williamsii]MDN4616194.1 GNAT family N-acetyltransferase [Leifsonia williamsii]